MLLIEFEEGIPFKLQDVERDVTAGAEISSQSIISKISLLTLHFPNLQIIWSKSPKHTAEICADLKKNLVGAQKDPDLQKIEKIGKVGTIEIETDAAQGSQLESLENPNQNSDNFNRLMPREFLKRIPGVTSNNINIIMKSVKNMIELVRLPEKDLKELVGSKNAKLIKNFLETKVGGGQWGDSDCEDDDDIDENQDKSDTNLSEYEKLKKA